MRDKIGQGAGGTNANIGGFSDNIYWSSTQVSANDATVHAFSSDFRFDLRKSDPASIRAIRAF